MLLTILVVIFGALFAYFSTYNTDTITVALGTYKEIDIALYLLILVSFGIGLTVAAFIYVSYYLSSSLTINEQKDKLKTTKKDLAEITKTAHKLELENTKLKAKLGIEVKDQNGF